MSIVLDEDELRDLNNLAEQVKAEPFTITPQDLYEAWNHSYYCTCSLCRQAWKAVGPDPDTNKYGPFGHTI